MDGYIAYYRLQMLPY